MIANSGGNEWGGLYGGDAGDQTGREWCVREWYSCPWLVVLRHPDQRLAQEFAYLARRAAGNEHIGYNQLNRMSFWEALEETGTYDPADISTACDDDCSAGVTACVKAAGVRLGYGDVASLDPATYTGNMRERFASVGFEELEEARYTDGDSFLYPGDVLLRDGYHVAMNLDLGDLAEGWDPEGNDIVNDKQNKALMELLRTDDPTGRGCTGSTPVERIAWLGKKTDEILKNQKALEGKLDKVLAALDAE